MSNSSRPWWLLVALAACGGDDEAFLEPPKCMPDGVLRYVHDLDGTEVRGELPPGPSLFFNKVSEDDPGILAVGDETTSHLRVEFESLLVDGGTVPATGYFKIGELDAGSCETTLSGRIHAFADDGWTVQLVDLHAPPYCTGEALGGSFAACFIPEPF